MSQQMNGLTYILIMPQSETKKLLDKKETILNPWDPLGTLAK